MSRQCISVSGLLDLRFGQSFGPEDLEPPKLPSWRWFKLRKQLQAGGLARGETSTEALAGGLNVMAQGTRKEIIAEIMNWSATWGSPLSREQAEAKADQTIKATRPRWGWFIVFTIVAMLWVWFIASTIATF